MFGEGPTAVVEGSFNDTKRTPFTGQDLRFTTKGNVLYAIALARPGSTLTIRSLARGKGATLPARSTVTLVGHGDPLRWTQTVAGLVVTLPSSVPEQAAYVFKVPFG